MFSIGRLEKTVFRFIGTTKDVLTTVFPDKIVADKIAAENRYPPERLGNYVQPAGDRFKMESQIAETVKTDLRPDHLRNGLTTEQVNVRLRAYGANEIRIRPSKTRMFLHQFKSVSAVSLFGFGVLAIALGKYLDAGIVFSVFIITGFISTRYKFKSEENYRKHLHSQKSVQVLRNGSIRHISPLDIVPDDIMYLKPGEIIPADAIVLRSNTFQVRELQVDATFQLKSKQALANHSTDANLRKSADEQSILYAGSIITRGTAKAIVMATGEHTRYGKLLKQPQHQQTFTEKRYNMYSKKLAKIGWGVLLLVGGFILAIQWSAPAAFQTAASVGTSLIPGGFSLPICLAYWGAMRKNQKNPQGVLSLHHVDHLEDTKCVILSEHALTDELNVSELWYGNHRLKPHDPIPNALVQAAKLFSNIENQTSDKDTEGINGTACADASIYDQAINKVFDRINNERTRESSTWRWIDHEDIEDYGLLEKRVFQDKNGRVVEMIRGPIRKIFDYCGKTMTPFQDLTQIESYESQPDSWFDRDGLQAWLAKVTQNKQFALGFAYKIQNDQNPNQTTSQDSQENGFIWVGAIAFSRKYIKMNTILNRLKEQNLPVFLMVDQFMEEDSDFWKAIEPITTTATADSDSTSDSNSTEAVRIHTIDADSFLKRLAQNRLGPHHVWVIHGNEQQRLNVVHGLREKYGDVRFIGCQEQERAYYGAAWTAIEQGILRGVHDVMDAIEQSTHARTRISRANGLIVSGNISEALYATVAGAMGAQHAHGPININIITNLIASMGLAIGGQKNGQTSKAKDIGELHKHILSRGVITGIISTIAYGLGYWIKNDALFASTFAFSTLILAQLMHALRLGDKDHTEKLSDIAEESVLVLATIGALGVLMICIHTPAAAQYFQLTPMALHEWLAAAALAGGVGPVAAKFEQPIWRTLQNFKRSSGKQNQTLQAA